nr:unnamed protein product [Digitaria exilis]
MGLDTAADVLPPVGATAASEDSLLDPFVYISNAFVAVAEELTKVAASGYSSATGGNGGRVQHDNGRVGATNVERRFLDAEVDVVGRGWRPSPEMPR